MDPFGGRYISCSEIFRNSQICAFKSFQKCTFLHTLKITSLSLNWREEETFFVLPDFDLLKNKEWEKSKHDFVGPTNKNRF